MAVARCSIDAVLLRQLVNQGRPEHQGEIGVRLALPASYGASSIQQSASVVSPPTFQWSPRNGRMASLDEVCMQRQCQVMAIGMRVAGAVSGSAEMALESEAGVSYELLRNRLAAGEWELADEETRRLLCLLAGEGAAKRKWVYFSEVQFIPSADFKTIDGLWRAYSKNKFGYSIQRRIWKSVDKDWTVFFRKVGWTRPLDDRNDTYCKFPLEFMWDLADPTPQGHLPLTNALRGTQLLEKILCHPAFDDSDRENELDLSTSFKLF
ncbi:hypothetical protein O6H91_01G141000 [Diphasiastrum complanatum]|uniref:Uncharacterized protein n=1 Tax=Diphasiastrum complanatum TaxID=34168 RepID=A0ACC2EWS8_DIPCM|nr:hypothetical protein O6H91_Y523500 [Diphasiastrum complanatum]KAJ7570942.1 hypothetical protein O6H91_01G141000 [Diphasiastrum complanatum]